MLTEMLVLTLIAVGGVSGAWILGARNTWLAIPVGMALVVVVRNLSFSALNLIGLRQFSAVTFFVILAAVALHAAWRARVGLWRPLSLAVGFALASVMTTRWLGFLGTSHGDSLWILSFSHLIENNGSMEILDGHTSIKRGFAYPLLLALGPNQQFLSALTPYIFAALACSVIWLATTLLAKYDWHQVALIGALLLLATFSSVMPLRSIYYINGHTLAGLGMLLAAGVTVLAIKENRLSLQNLAVACAGIFTVSASRAEGIALAALIVLPLISARFISRWQIIALVSSATVSLGVWLATYHSYIIHSTHLPWIVFDTILVGLGCLPALRWLDWLRHRLVGVALVAMPLVIVLAELRYAKDLAKGNRSLFANLFLGQGFWGFGLAAVLILVAIFSFKRWSKFTSEHKTLLIITVSLVLGSLIAKMLDGGQFGHPTLGRLGWSDSLNRMWIQSFGIFLVTALVAIVQSIWQPRTTNKG
jgi:hypothetical protein